MKKRCLSALTLLLLQLSWCNAQQTSFDRPARGFTSWLPAANWEQSLLSGNGTMGAMVAGEPYDESVILSHAALYLPQNRSGKRFSQQENLPEIRRLLLEGKYKEAAAVPEILRRQTGYTDQRDPFIPAFDLHIRTGPENVLQYQRSVNFETGEATVDWRDQKGTHQRSIFVSRADSLIVVKWKSTQKINCEIDFTQRPARWDQQSFIREGVKVMHSSVVDNLLTYSSEFNHKYPGGLQGYAGVGRVIQSGGTQVQSGNKLLIHDADEVLLLIRIRPDFGSEGNLLSRLQAELSAIVPPKSGTPAALYAQLLSRHSSIHAGLFNRVKLNLNADPGERKLTSEALILRGNSDPGKALIERTFDAGRYNILSATGTRPPNLQGLWSGTWTAPWSSGFTTDGNLPTAMSILLPGNMPELMKSFFDYHESMLPEYRRQARELYGTQGIHIPAQLTTRGLETDFGPVWCLTFWTGAAGWTANAFNDYYQYTGDLQFLRTRAYPFMKEAALFYTQFLQTGKDGKLLFLPSYSPENNPLGIDAQATINATMDVMIAKQLLRNCIAAATTLGVDQQAKQTWRKMLDRMPAYEINRDGALKEWLWPGLEDNYSHRHVSQLYALFDGPDWDFDRSPSLRKAAQVLIDKKLDFRRAEGGGEMAFGLVQLGAAAAHIGNAGQAAQLLKWLSSKYWTRGMGSYHNVGELFNTDISGGLPYLVTQVLCQSVPGEVRLLPALPADWNTGEVNGLLLKGQLRLDSLKWSPDQVTAALTSGLAQSVKISCRGQVRTLKFGSGQTRVVTF